MTNAYVLAWISPEGEVTHVGVYSESHETITRSSRSVPALILTTEGESYEAARDAAASWYERYCPLAKSHPLPKDESEPGTVVAVVRS